MTGVVASDASSTTTAVLRCVAEVLGRNAASIDPERELGELGLEAYTAVRLRHRLREELGLDVPLARLLAGGTVHTIASGVGGTADRADPSEADDLLAEADWSSVRARAAEHGLRPLTVLVAAFDLVLRRFDVPGHGTVAVATPTARTVLAGPAGRPPAWAGFTAHAGTVAGWLAQAAPAPVGDDRQVWFGYDTEPPPDAGLRLTATNDPRGLVLRWRGSDELPAELLPALRAALGRLLRLLAADLDAWHRPDLGWDPSFRLPEPMTAQPFGNAGPLLDDPLRQAAARRPEAPALLGPAGTVSHGELARWAETIAAELAVLGVGPGDLVGVLLPKGPAQIAAVLGVLRCGAGYVPIDPSWPAARVAAVCGRAELRHALVAREPASAGAAGDTTSPDTALPAAVRRIAVPGAAPAAPSSGHPDNGGRREPVGDGARPAPDDPAYAIFTSGSTGTPKGVAIEHRQARTTVDDVTARFGIGPGDRVLGLSALSFDLSVYDIFGLLGAGGALVLPDPAAIRDPEHWLELIGRHRVTVWNTAPALMEMLVSYAEADAAAARAALASLRLVLLSGDWIPVTLPDRLRVLAPQARFISLGGATEGAIWSIFFPVERVDPAWPSIPYGRPLDGQFFYILDEAGLPCPVGHPGELYIAGDGVARGYLGDPEQTARQFAVHPLLGQRLYRTGDLGCWRLDGTIEFLGRVDRQVKVDGYRVELGEIDSVLNRLPQVRQAVSGVESAPDGRRRLVAYVVPAAPAGCSRPSFVADLTTELASRLPRYMVPARFVTLDAMSITNNGKIDHGALQAAAASAGSPAAPTGPGRIPAAVRAEPAGPGGVPVAPEAPTPGDAGAGAPPGADLDGSWLREAAADAARHGLRLSLVIGPDSADVLTALTSAGPWLRRLAQRLAAAGVPVRSTLPSSLGNLVELVVRAPASDARE